jgi:hypothetical protein
MDEDRIKQLKAKLEAPPPPALERLREFLWAYVNDGDSDLLKLEAKKRPGPIADAVEAIEEVLAEQHPPGTLAQMVACEGNRALADQTDAAAIAWLRKLATDLRQWLGDHAPQPRQLPEAR